MEFQTVQRMSTVQMCVKVMHDEFALSMLPPDFHAIENRAERLP